MPFLAPAIIGTGSSILGSIFGNKPQQQTSTTTPTLSPQMQQVMDQLLAYQQTTMANPESGLAPIKTAAQERINRNYAGAPDRIQSQLSRRGYGSSGKLPAGLYGLESSRMGDLGDIEGKFAQIGSDRSMQAASIVQNILGSMRGSTTTGTMPGNPGAGLSAAGTSLGNLSSLMMLQQMLKGGNGVSSGPSSSVLPGSGYTPPAYTPGNAGPAPYVPPPPGGGLPGGFY